MKDLRITKEQALKVSDYIKNWRKNNPYKRRSLDEFNRKFNQDLKRFMVSENYTPEQIDFFVEK